MVRFLSADKEIIMCENTDSKDDTKNIVQTLDKIREKLNYMHSIEKMSWREIASKGIFGDVPFSTLSEIAKGREPKTPELRLKLGLPAMIPIEICPSCGIVHVKKCPKMKKVNPKKIQDMSKEELLWALENREVM